MHHGCAARRAQASRIHFDGRFLPGGRSGEELEAMIRVGAFDEFGETRTRQFWQAQHLLKNLGPSIQASQAWLIPVPGLEKVPGIQLNEPTRRERLESESDLLGFAVSGHPLE